MLHNVAYRFAEKERVYTYCGIVLVAVNPYADCRDLYGDEMIQVRYIEKKYHELIRFGNMRMDAIRHCNYCCFTFFVVVLLKPEILLHTIAQTSG